MRSFLVATSVAWLVVSLSDGAAAQDFRTPPTVVRLKDKIKIDFVHHVSYELRSPLTNIIGFSHFLGDPVTGPLTDRQREYLGYIQVSTNSLLAIISAAVVDESGHLTPVNAVAKLDPREEQPLIKPFAQRSEALAQYRQAIATSLERGWSVAYQGAAMFG